MSSASETLALPESGHSPSCHPVEKIRSIAKNPGYSKLLQVNQGVLKHFYFRPNLSFRLPPAGGLQLQAVELAKKGFRTVALASLNLEL
jgi:hypothetical protein